MFFYFTLYLVITISWKHFDHKIKYTKYASDVPDFKYLQLDDLKQEDQNFSTIKH